VSTTTESLCPQCLERIPAERRREGDTVFLVKTCPEHGEFRVPVWRGEPHLALWSGPPKSVGLGTHIPAGSRGCPFDCGLCPDHRQKTCTVLLEVTGRCNLSCAFCFADAGGQADDDPPLEVLAERFRLAMAQGGPRSILQLSGGEPTVRDDLPAIIALGRDAGFTHMQLNSNGVRLASDAEYAKELAQAGLFSVFLQFDGTDDRVYQSIRGRSLMAEKLRAIEHCVAAGLGVVLVPTLVVGVNTDEVGAILKLALDLAPGVRGVHFQPASYFGRYPGPPPPEERFTLPDLMRAIEEQTGGLMKAEHFGPPGCEHSTCSFHGNFLRLADGGLEPLSDQATGSSCCSTPTEGADRAVSYVAKQWAAPTSGSGCCSTDSIETFVESHRANTFAVSAMAFQDVWNLDLERVRECCIHVAVPDGRMIPFCLYNLTSAEGTPLYRTSPC
jgi:7,8-dihydro-6-hydroxymethylpterin dimethyltransferase